MCVSSFLGRRVGCAMVTALSLLALSFGGPAGCSGRYVCGAPEGSPCRSLTQVYRDSLVEFEEGRETWIARGRGHARLARVPALSVPARVPILEAAPGEPLLTRPRQLRLWLSAWEDAAGDLHGESFLYLRLEGSRWSGPGSVPGGDLSVPGASETP